MQQETNGDTPRRLRRIRKVARQCFRRREQGEPLSDEDVIKANPDLMPELADELRHLRLVHAALEQPSDEVDAAVLYGEPPREVPGTPRALHVRCPHCHSQIDIAVDSQLDDITCSSCGSHFSLVQDESTTRAAPTISTVGHFQLIERLGIGGFGTVWKARDTQLDRMVALKMPRRGQLEPSEVEQFLREGRAAAQLNHPNIVTTHEIGRDGETVYIVSDLVPGISLADRLSAGERMSAREAAELCAKIAEALGHAHQVGVVHRDLKPHNIMLDEHGEPHLMDFGLARREAGEITVTIDGQVLGTPAYMSPEQAKGEAHQADRRSDIYSVGVILFELLTGELPFRGNSRMLIHQLIHDEPPSPCKFNTSVPKDLETICLKCLEKAPDRRYGWAHELADELSRYVRGKPIRARPVSGYERTWRWCQRNPVVSTLAAGLTAVLLAGFVGVTSQWMRAEHEAMRNRDLLYAANVDLAYRAWEAANISRAASLLRQHIPPYDGEDLRGFEWYYVFRLIQRSLMTPTLGGRSPTFTAADELAFSQGSTVQLMHVNSKQSQTIFKADRNVRNFALSRNGKTLAVYIRGSILICDVATGQNREVRIFDEIFEETTPLAFSPDGRILAYCQASTIKRIDVDTGQAHGDDLTGHTGNIRALCFSEGGELLASAGRDERVILWSLRTGKPTSFKGHVGIVECVAFSPNGKIVATGDAGRVVRVYDVETRELRTLPGHSGNISCLAFSPDGETLASGSADNTVKLWSLSTHTLLDTLRGHGGRVISLAFSNNGKTLAAGSRSGNIKLWDIGAERNRDEWIASTGRGVNFASFSPDGKTLGTSGWDGVIRLWDAATGNSVVQLPGHPGPDNPTFSRRGPDGVQFSRTGEVFASYGADGTIKIWDAASHKLLGPAIEAHDDLVWGVDFSPDDKTLASGSEDGTVKLWNLDTHDQLAELVDHTGMIVVAFSPDGMMLASGGRDGTLCIWDVATYELIRRLKAHEGRIVTVAFSADGKTIASAGSDTTVRRWDVGTGGMLRPLIRHAAEVMAVTYLDDGKTLASCSFGMVKLCDAASGAERCTLPVPGDTNYMTCSPNGKSLALCGRDGRIRLWRAATDDDVRAAGW